MKKIIIGILIGATVICGQMQAMDDSFNDEDLVDIQDQIGDMVTGFISGCTETSSSRASSNSSSPSASLRSSEVLEADAVGKNSTKDEGDSVDQCIEGLINTLQTMRPVLNGMHDSGALNVKAITKFYDVSTSTWRYRGLYGAELLVGTAHNSNSSLARPAHLVYSLAKNVPFVGGVLERFEPNNNNNNNNNNDGERSSHPSASSSVTPISDAAYTLRKLNLNKVVIDTMQEHEPVVNDLLTFMHEMTSKHGDTAISFLKQHQEIIGDTLRTTARYVKDNKQEITNTMQTVREVYNEYGETAKVYLKEHSAEIKQHAEKARTYFFPVLMAGMKAAHQEHVRIKNQQALLAAQDKHDSLLLKVSPDALVRRKAEGRDEGMLDWIK